MNNETILRIKMDSKQFFENMVDELVEFAEYDPELADGIKWLDNKAKNEGVTFYDIVYKVLLKHDSDTKARQWLKEKNERDKT